MKKLILLLGALFLYYSVKAQLLMHSNCDNTIFVNVNQQKSDKVQTKSLYLDKTIGKLDIYCPATNSPFEVYFIVPIAFREQAPVWIDVQCPGLVDYRFVRLDNNNAFVAARINNSSSAIELDWTSWVLVKKPDYSGIPATVPIPSYNELPDSVKPYLIPTGCVQWEDPFVKHICDSIRGTSNDLRVLANKIRMYCYNIPWEFPVSPMSFDAYYAMKWGNSCTGHAHAGAALFRANGVPCRILMNMPLMNDYDMHWIIEYFVPNYGWVKMETSSGSNPYVNAHQEIITFACNPEDEFSMTYPDNIESYWFTSDTVFQHNSPDWGMGHSALQDHIVSDTAAKIDQIISLTDSVYRYFTIYKGITLTLGQQDLFMTATDFQYKAFNHIHSGKKDSLIYYLTKSLDYYRRIELKPLQTVYFDDFENGLNGWTHAGIVDEWELGTPINMGPLHTYSGINCWGTDLDSLYDNNSNCWLISPSIYLNNLSCAYMSVKIWNDVEDFFQGSSPKDKLWIELSSDGGATYIPITTHLGGVIDYNTGIPKVPGWSRIVLDLTPYVNSTIKVRFHFTSDSGKSRPGSYIDDFLIYGREMSSQGIAENNSNQSFFDIFPNPATNKIKINFHGEIPNVAIISFFNIQGDKLITNTIHHENSLDIDVSALVTGVYLVKIQTENSFMLKKLVIQ